MNNCWRFPLVSLVITFAITANCVAFNGWTDQDLADSGQVQKTTITESGSIRNANEDWVFATALVNRNADWSAWLKEREAVNRAWIAGQSDQLGWIAGWAHNYIEPDGSSRKWTINDPLRDDVNPESAKLRGGWVYYFRMNNVDRIVESARLFRLTGDTLYSDWAISQLMLYSEGYKKWPLQTWNGKARLLNQSLDEAVVTFGLLEAVRLLSEKITLAQRIKLKQDLFDPIASNLIASYQGINNISLWHASAVSMIGFEFSDKELLSAGLDGDHGIRKILKAGVTKQWIWHEGSFGYHNYAIRSLLPLFLGADLRGFGYLLAQEKLVVQSMLLSPSQFRFDDGFLPSPGDVIGNLRAPDNGLLSEAWRTLPTRIGLAEVSIRKNWDTLLDRVTDLELFGSLPKVNSTNASESQFVLLKKNDWQAFVHLGHLVSNHAHEDATAYELYWKSTPISRDPGTVSYGSKLYGEYFRKAVAHNVPIINGQGQKNFVTGRLQSFDANAAKIVVDQPRYRDGMGVKRDFAIEDAAFVDRLTFTNSLDNDPHRVGLLVNLDCHVELPDAMQEQMAAQLPGTPGFSYWIKPRAFAMPPKWSVKLNCSGIPFIFSFSMSVGQTVYFGSVPTTPPPASRSAIYIEPSYSKILRFETRFSPAKVSAP